eukprot:XP_001690550.1 predicted protein [Chlamydomonas reinhardtii]
MGNSLRFYDWESVSGSATYFCMTGPLPASTDLSLQAYTFPNTSSFPCSVSLVQPFVPDYNSQVRGAGMGKITWKFPWTSQACYCFRAGSVQRNSDYNGFSWTCNDVAQCYCEPTPVQYWAQVGSVQGAWKNHRTVYGCNTLFKSGCTPITSQQYQLSPAEFGNRMNQMCVGAGPCIETTAWEPLANQDPFTAKCYMKFVGKASSNGTMEMLKSTLKQAFSRDVSCDAKYRDISYDITQCYSPSKLTAVIYDVNGRVMGDLSMMYTCSSASIPCATVVRALGSAAGSVIPYASTVTGLFAPMICTPV